MAEIEKKNEWGAGLLAIAATLFIGAAIPVILFFVVYKPQVQRKEEQKVRTVQLGTQLDEQMARGGKLLELQGEGEEVAKSLTELETRFASSDVQNAIGRLLALLNASNLKRTPEAVVRREKDPIRRTDMKDEFPNGLQASMVTINCFGKWSDFVNFIAAAESEEKFTFVVGEFYAEGDRNGKEEHTFLVDIWIVQGRNIPAIGVATAAPAK
ncbi:MAG: hypothetical protein IT461_08830 [Planctomycetes bacterium]|jgi:hypothetical protein|nr:hypothetical protein [Planctomycetota bacterium]